MKKILATLALALVALYAAEVSAAPLSPAFTYQGRLDDGGQPANGLYDLAFTLHNDPTNAPFLGTYIILSTVPVTNGPFTVELNGAGEFGVNAFNGEARWLQIGVRGKMPPAENLALLIPEKNFP